MQREITSLKNCNTFTWTTLPQNKRLVGGKWVFRVKIDANGNTAGYKARYVAQGYTQRPGDDYTETHAPTPNPASIRTVLHIATQNNWAIRQMDVNTAYFHADIEEEVYLEPPIGFEKFDNNGNLLVWKLNKSLYGLKQT